jgi:hypothetical protein
MAGPYTINDGQMGALVGIVSNLINLRMKMNMNIKAEKHVEVTKEALGKACTSLQSWVEGAAGMNPWEGQAPEQPREVPESEVNTVTSLAVDLNTLSVEERRALGI